MTTKQIEELREAAKVATSTLRHHGVEMHPDDILGLVQDIAATLTERSTPESEEDARLAITQQSAKPAWEWFTPSEKMPPLHQQVIVELKDGPGQVCDVACYIGKVAGDGGKTEDRWILADVRLDTRQIKRWALIHLHTTTDPESAG